MYNGAFAYKVALLIDAIRMSTFIFPDQVHSLFFTNMVISHRFIHNDQSHEMQCRCKKYVPIYATYGNPFNSSSDLYYISGMSSFYSYY